MMMNRASLEAEFAAVRAHAPRPRGSNPHWGPHEQARAGYAARMKNTAKRNVSTSVALEAKAPGEMELKFQQPRCPL
jgi:hypothetical protein